MSLKIEWEGDQGNRVAIGKWRRWPRLQLTAAAALYTNSWRGSFLILDSTHILKNVDDGKSPADVSYQALCTTSLGWTLFVSLRVNQTKLKRVHGGFTVVIWKKPSFANSSLFERRIMGNNWKGSNLLKNLLTRWVDYGAERRNFKATSSCLFKVLSSYIPFMSFFQKEIASMQISMLGCETVGEVWLWSRGFFFPTWSPWAVSWESSHPFLGSAVIGIKSWTTFNASSIALTQLPRVILRFDSIQSEGNVAAADQFFLSHCHADHMKGIDTLAMFLRYWVCYPGSTSTLMIQEKG